MALLDWLFRKPEPDLVLEKFKKDIALDVGRAKAASDRNRDQAIAAIKISGLRQQIAIKRAFVDKLWKMIQENNERYGPLASRYSAGHFIKISEYEGDIRRLQAELASIESGS